VCGQHALKLGDQAFKISAANRTEAVRQDPNRVLLDLEKLASVVVALREVAFREEAAGAIRGEHETFAHFD
jgi:hypothetical protein